ncbi:hypothetical protein T492DRAFT_888375 [Pavlovales sp. CCMP2436]|nr:hypothetical protein T492DRAFT_888375 [Pavlovales sp. CCMP2436]
MSSVTASEHKAAGNAAWAKGDVDAAIVSYNVDIAVVFSVGKLDDAVFESLNINLAMCYLRKGGKANCGYACDRAMTALSRSSSAKGHFSLVRALHELGSDEEASYHAQKALELSPGVPKIRELCAALPAPSVPGASSETPPRIAAFLDSHVTSEWRAQCLLDCLRSVRAQDLDEDEAANFLLHVSWSVDASLPVSLVEELSAAITAACAPLGRTFEHLRVCHEGLHAQLRAEGVDAESVWFGTNLTSTTISAARTDV